MKLWLQIVLEQNITDLSAKIAIRESSDVSKQLHKTVADCKLQIVSIAIATMIVITTRAMV